MANDVDALGIVQRAFADAAANRTRAVGDFAPYAKNVVVVLMGREKPLKGAQNYLDLLDLLKRMGYTWEPKLHFTGKTKSGKECIATLMESKAGLAMSIDEVSKAGEIDKATVFGNFGKILREVGDE